MTIEQKQNGNQLVMNIAGRLDTSTAPELEEALSKVSGEVTELVFECKDLEYISSAGLRVLLKAQKKMNTVGSMKVTHVNDAIMEVFTITGFDSILTIE